MRLHYTIEKGFNGLRACAAGHAWQPSPSPPPLPLPVGERKGEHGAESKNAGTPTPPTTAPENNPDATWNMGLRARTLEPLTQ